MTTTINADNVTGGAVVTGDSSGELGLQTAGTTRMTITSAGNVGIGVTPSAAKLHVETSANEVEGSFRNSSASYTSDLAQIYQTNASATLTSFHLLRAYSSGPTVRFHVRGDGEGYFAGNVGIRTSSPVSPLTVYQASSGTPSLGSATYYGPVFQNSFGGYGLGVNINSATGISLIQSQRFDGTATAYDIALNPLGGNVGIGTSTPGQALTIGRTGANAQIYVSTTTSGNPSIYLDASGVNNGQFFVDRSDAGIAKLQAGGNLVFQTNGANERMRIDTSGDVLIAGSTARDAERLTIYQGGGGWNYGLCLADNGGNNGFIGAGGGPGIYFAAGAGNPVGSLNSSGNFIDASDKAYKKDVRDIQYGLSTVLSLAPKSYRLIANNRAGVGFIAQDMEQVIPEIVSGEEGTKGIAYGQLTAVLVKAIQEQQQQIDALKAEVAALKGE